jgi:hypothetical protein
MVAACRLRFFSRYETTDAEIRLTTEIRGGAHRMLPIVLLSPVRPIVKEEAGLLFFEVEKTSPQSTCNPSASPSSLNPLTASKSLCSETATPWRTDFRAAPTAPECLENFSRDCCGSSTVSSGGYRTELPEKTCRTEMLNPAPFVQPQMMMVSMTECRKPVSK